MFGIECSGIGRTAALAQARPRFPVIEARDLEYRRAAARELSEYRSKYCVAIISAADLEGHITLMDFSFSPTAALSFAVMRQICIADARKSNFRGMPIWPTTAFVVGLSSRI
jgi:hypothetical protein